MGNEHRYMRLVHAAHAPAGLATAGAHPRSRGSQHKSGCWFAVHRLVRVENGLIGNKASPLCFTTTVRRHALQWEAWCRPHVHCRTVANQAGTLWTSHCLTLGLGVLVRACHAWCRHNRCRHQRVIRHHSGPSLALSLGFHPPLQVVIVAHQVKDRCGHHANGFKT